jgi:NAD(P)-dependent dehydrogenase (short-subunit alcohol dehydrogenase family)
MSMPFPSMKPEGKIGIVTGAGGGLGKMISLALSEAGASLVLVDLDPAGNEELAQRIRSAGGQALAATADVTRTEDLEVVRDRCLDAHGRIDILINNAGISPIYKRMERVAVADWDAILEINLKGVFLCTQVIGGVMREQNRGKIVNIASVVGTEGSPRLVPYAASKAGVINLTRTLAREWAAYNINVNAVAPGYFEVGMGEPMLSQETLRNQVLSRIPMGRLGKKEEICGAVVFLASEAADYITGQILMVDGGWWA